MTIDLLWFVCFVFFFGVALTLPAPPSSGYSARPFFPPELMNGFSLFAISSLFPA